MAHRQPHVLGPGYLSNTMACSPGSTGGQKSHRTSMGHLENGFLPPLQQLHFGSHSTSARCLSCRDGDGWWTASAGGAGGAAYSIHPCAMPLSTPSQPRSLAPSLPTYINHAAARAKSGEPGTLGWQIGCLPPCRDHSLAGPATDSPRGSLQQCTSFLRWRCGYRVLATALASRLQWAHGTGEWLST